MLTLVPFDFDQTTTVDSTLVLAFVHNRFCSVYTSIYCMCGRNFTDVDHVHPLSKGDVQALALSKGVVIYVNTM